MRAVGAKTAGIHGPIGRAGGTHQREKSRIAQCLLPNRHPPQPVDTPSRRTWRREAIISQPAGRGLTIATNMAGTRHPTSSSVQLAITWPAQNCANVLLPAWCAEAGPTVPPFTLPRRAAARGFGSQPLRPGPLPQRGPAIGPSTPAPSPDATEQFPCRTARELVRRPGHRPSRGLNSRNPIAQRRERPPPTTPQIPEPAQLITRVAGRTTDGVVQEEAERAAPGRAPARDRHRTPWNRAVDTSAAGRRARDPAAPASFLSL